MESIRIRYQPRLETIQADCESQLNATVDSAKTEYDRAKQGGGQVDVAALGAKYIAKATSLRRGCDKEVEAVLRDVGADLRAAGLPQDLVAEIQDTYEARIAERQAEIMAKAPAR